MPFKEFIGNLSIVQTLRHQLRVDRLPHALLFAGPAGVGKKTLALDLAKALNCLVTDFDFCDHCSSCRKINDNSHPDVRTYAPEEQFLKIDLMREFSREVFYRPFEGKARVFVLEQTERLTMEAANSILKTIEEPPETSTIVMVSEKPNDLLLTIRSRAQLYQFAPLSADVIAGWLAVRRNLSPQDSALLASVSGGALGIALEIDIEEYKRIRDELTGLLESCAIEFAYHKVAGVVEKITSRKESEKAQFGLRLEVLWGLLQDLLHLGIDKTVTIRNGDIKDRLGDLSRRLSFSQVLFASELLDKIELGVKRNLNRSLLMDRMVFGLGGFLTNE